MLMALEMSNPFLPLLIANQPDISAQSAALLNALALALPMLANILMGPIWGKLADRYGYKPMLMRAAWALVLTQFLMSFTTSIHAILSIRLLQGGFAGFISAMQTYTLSLSSWHEKTQQLTRLQSAKAVATSLAGVSGGLLLSWVNFQELFLITGLLCLITAIAMQCYLPASRNSQFKPSSNKLPAMHFNQAFLITVSLIALTQIAKFLPEPGFTLYMTTVLHQQPWMIGLLYSLPAVGILLTSQWCGKQFDRCRRNQTKVNRYFRNYLALAMLLMLAHMFMQNMFLLILVRFAWGLVIAALLPAFFTLISDQSHEQGYLLGIANSCAKLGNLLGLLLGGWLAGFMPLHFVFLIIAGIYLLMFMLNRINSVFEPKASQQYAHSL